MSAIVGPSIRLRHPNGEGRARAFEFWEERDTMRFLGRPAVVAVCLVGALGGGVACDGGGGGGSSADDVAMGDAATATDGSGEAGGGGSPGNWQGAWFAYVPYFFGFVQARFELTVSESAFEERVAVWMGGGEWLTLLDLRGTVSADDAGVTFGLSGLKLAAAQGGDDQWHDEGSPEFDALSRYVWGAQVDRPARFDAAAGTFLVELDVDGDGRSDTSGERLLFTRTARNEATLDEHGAGSFPFVSYVGLGFHNTFDDAAIYIQIQNVDPPSRVATATASLSGPGGVRYGDIPLVWFEERHEWGASPYLLPLPASGGLWWIDEVKVELTDGSRSTFSAATPFESGYRFALVSTTGFSAADQPSPTLVAEDYAPEAGGTFYDLETFANASRSDVRVDPALKVFRSDDTERWFAFNDDGGRGPLDAGLRLPLVSGATYYVVVEDRYGNGGTYAVKIGKSGFDGTSAGTAEVPDAHEPDDGPGEATPLVLDEVQDHSFTPRDEDWFVFTAP